MKKQLHMLVVLLLAGGIMANAQVQRGNVLIGANIANFQLGLKKGGHFEMLINPKASMWFEMVD